MDEVAEGSRLLGQRWRDVDVSRVSETAPIQGECWVCGAKLTNETGWTLSHPSRTKLECPDPANHLATRHRAPTTETYENARADERKACLGLARMVAKEYEGYSRGPAATNRDVHIAAGAALVAAEIEKRDRRRPTDPRDAICAAVGRLMSATIPYAHNQAMTALSDAWANYQQQSDPSEEVRPPQEYSAVAPERVELWDAIHEYARAIYTGKERAPSGERMTAVSRVTRAVEDGMFALLQRERVRERATPPAECDQANSIVPEIVEWLMGLESARESVAVGGSDPREVAVMMARRGVYEGIADDIKRKWGKR